MCAILSNSFFFGEGRICDSPFYSSSNFIAIPAIGPLTLGHSMVVSRQHAPSLLTMDTASKQDFVETCRVLSNAWDGPKIIFAEHGSSAIDSTGPCICHTHINAIPGVAVNLLDLGALGHQVIAQGSLHELPEVQESYFLVGTPDSWMVYDLHGAPSQHLRMILHASFGLQHWDWRLLPNENLANETYAHWLRTLAEDA